MLIAVVYSLLFFALLATTVLRHNAYLKCIKYINIMHKVNLRSIDLNLLAILEALLKEQHITRAANQLSMSQPAVSRALQRLRQTFADPLLIRQGAEGYALTPRAEQLLPELERALNCIRDMLSPNVFTPATASDVVHIACLDLEAAIYLPKVIEAMREQAPNMRLEVHSRPDDAFAQLARGELHFAINGLEPRQTSDAYYRKVLDTTHNLCLMGQANPLSRKPLTMADYLGASHGFVSITGKGNAIIDEHLSQRGLKRNIALRLPSFFNVPDVCESTDLLFALPKRLAERLAHNRKLIVKPLPGELNLGEFNIYLTWHARYHNDAMHHWVRELIKSVNL